MGRTWFRVSLVYTVILTESAREGLATFSLRVGKFRLTQNARETPTNLCYCRFLSYDGEGASSHGMAARVLLQKKRLLATSMQSTNLLMYVL